MHCRRYWPSCPWWDRQGPTDVSRWRQRSGRGVRRVEDHFQAAPWSRTLCCWWIQSASSSPWASAGFSGSNCFIHWRVAAMTSFALRPLSSTRVRCRTPSTGFLRFSKQRRDGLAGDGHVLLQGAALVDNAVNPAVRMVAVGIADAVLHVADDGVRPIGNVECAVWRRTRRRWDGSSGRRCGGNPPWECPRSGRA